MASKRGKDSPNMSPDRADTSADGPSKTKKGNFKKPAAPEAKTSKSSPMLREAHHLGSVSSLDAMEPKVLLFQNKKLAERLEHYQVTTEELRNRNEQLQQRLSATDAEIFIINRHTKSLEENVRILLKRFDQEDAAEGENENPRSPLTSFINQLSTLDEEELDKNLAGRVQEMLNLIGKLVQVYDDVSIQSRSVLEKIKNGESVEEDCKNQITQLLKKNEALEKQALSMQRKCYEANSKAAKADDKISELETDRDEQKNRVAELEWSLEKEQVRREKVEHMVMEVREKVKVYEAQLATQLKEGQAAEGNVVIAAPSVSQTKMGEMVTDLEEHKTLAANRLQEIEKLHAEKVALTLDVEELKVKVESPPDDLVEKSAKYKSLQTHFSVLYMEHEKVKEYYKMAKEAVNTLRSSYLQQLKEAQRHEEDGSLTLQTFLSNLQTATNAARRDYQMLRIEYEQEHASRETSGTNKDYDKLFKSVMQNNSSLEREVARLRKCVQTLKNDLAKTRDPSRQNKAAGSMSPDKRNASDSDLVKRDSAGTDGSSTPKGSQNFGVTGEVAEYLESIKELKKQLKDKTKEYDELKLLFDMTKEAGKTKRELVDIMASEKRLKEENVDLKRQVSTLESRCQTSETDCQTATTEVESLRGRVRHLEERSTELEKERDKEKAERQRTGPDEELLKRVKFLEEAWATTKKALANQNAQEEALYSEMDVTGQALEDLQNQNKQLIDQLKEKDSTNLKWMADNIRNNQLIKTLRDEKSAQEIRYRTLQECVGKYELQLKLAEERLKSVEDANNLLEENQKSSDYLTESWKRKAFDQTKETGDLRLKLDQLDKELRFVRTVHADKLKSYEGEAYKSKRLIEENSELRRRLDRAKLIEVTGSSEEILKEDLREYKELLNCNSCKAARKDTVLTKCFHVFCYSCISKRYETRQRRCPQCSTQFGANDYHRLYLT